MGTKQDVFTGKLLSITIVPTSSHGAARALPHAVQSDDPSDLYELGEIEASESMSQTF